MKPKPIYSENDFIYLQLTIEVYGKNWYMDLYYTQTHLVWNSQTQVELKIKTKYKIDSKMAERKCPLETSMVDFLPLKP